MSQSASSRINEQVKAQRAAQAAHLDKIREELAARPMSSASRSAIEAGYAARSAGARSKGINSTDHGTTQVERLAINVSQKENKIQNLELGMIEVVAQAKSLEAHCGHASKIVSVEETAIYPHSSLLTPADLLDTQKVVAVMKRAQEVIHKLVIMTAEASKAQERGSEAAQLLALCVNTEALNIEDVREAIRGRMDMGRLAEVEADVERVILSITSLDKASSSRIAQIDGVEPDVQASSSGL